MLDEPLRELPLQRSWVDDIVEVLLHRPNGTADVSTIANEIMKMNREVRATPEQTITRAINNYCGDANDLSRNPRYDIFERIAPNTYRLRTYPQAPDLIEIQNIRFNDEVYQEIWKTFWHKCEKRDGDQFRLLTDREKLNRFAEKLRDDPQWQRLLKDERERIKTIRNIADEIVRDLDI